MRPFLHLRCESHVQAGPGPGSTSSIERNKARWMEELDPPHSRYVSSSPVSGAFHSLSEGSAWREVNGSAGLSHEDKGKRSDCGTRGHEDAHAAALEVLSTTPKNSFTRYGAWFEMSVLGKLLVSML